MGCMITDILINKMGFKNATHKCNLYLGTINGEELIICCQVDDFASGSATRRTAERFLDLVLEHVKAKFAGMGIKIPDKGVYQRYNGINVFRMRD